MKDYNSVNSKEKLSLSHSIKKQKNNIKLESKEKINIPKTGNKNKNSLKYLNLTTTNNIFDKNWNKNHLSRNPILKIDNMKLKSYTNQFLTNDDKKKIKSIINDFDKNKILTERLLKKEENLALNSVNNSNYTSLLRPNNKNIKNRKSIYINYRNKFNDLTSDMINQFNNRTFDILIKPNNNIIYSTNLNYFRQQLINNYTENDEQNIENNKKRYNDAMKVGEINDKKTSKLAIEMEKNFYENKYNYLFRTDFNINNKRKNNLISLKKGKFRNSLSKKLGKIHENMLISPLTSKRGSLILNNISKENKEKDKIQKQNKKISQKDLYNKYVLNYKTPKKEKNNINIKSQYSFRKFKKIQKIKNLNNIKKHSSDYANSIYEVNDYPYEDINGANRRHNINNINPHNLLRSIKINTINKYLYNKEDDVLLIHDVKKLKEEIMKVQNECNRNNYRTNYNFSFLKAKLRNRTNLKFNYIKNSCFGIPC